jgi:hypothetical protein
VLKSALLGNTDGKFLDGSVTHTNYEQGAWWQVDLGGQKNIKKMKCASKDLQNDILHTYIPKTF